MFVKLGLVIDNGEQSTFLRVKLYCIVFDFEIFYKRRSNALESFCDFLGLSSFIFGMFSCFFFFSSLKSPKATSTTGHLGKTLPNFSAIAI